jgi:hypothetical protein
LEADGLLAEGRRPLLRGTRAVERVVEEKPQRGDDAVHRRRRDAGLLLLDLEAAKILGHSRVGRAPQPSCEPSDIAQI